jgi:2-polyprenyl-3-methyl-5-hydroxy-6-metoxy-1,4-benzoquinol methylase
MPFKNPGPEFYEKICALRNICSFSDEQEYDHKRFIDNMPVNKGNLLDIGCGTGAYLKRIKDKEFYVEGIDFDERAIDTARNKYGLKQTYVMTLSEFSGKFPEKKFDIATGFQVLEHVDDPSDFIINIKRLLRPGGYLVLSTPNRERWVGPQPMPDSLYGAKGDYPPVHLTRWNKKAISYLLKSQGFEIIELEVLPVSMAEARELFTRNIPFIYKNQAAIVTQLMNSEMIINASKKKALIIGGLLNSLRYVRKAMLSLLVFPIFVYARMKKRQGCFLYVVAKLTNG